jgi:hypothetical protein
MGEITNSDSRIVAIHAALVPSKPTGEIIYFAGFFGGEEGRSRLYDCQDGTTEAITAGPDDPDGGGTPGPFDSNDDGIPDVNSFCSGHVFLADGRWLVAGGSAGSGVIGPHEHGHGGTGSHDVFTYHARAKEWKRRDSLHFQPGSTERGGGRWYPTLVTLADGQVLAVGGHPRAGDDAHADNYPTPDTRRHSNNTPERYAPSLNDWTLMFGDITAPNGPEHQLDEYDRLHLTPTGHVFFSTLAKSMGDTRLFDPYTGYFVEDGYGNHLDAAYDDANCSARTTSIVLPILWDDPEQFWVFVCGSTEAERINLEAKDPAWSQAGSRDWAGTPPVREHLLGILLPTGQIYVACGMNGDPRTGVMEPEIYTPPINWSTGKYIGNQSGSWQTLAGDAGIVPRGYHSVALLQPDGRVWTAGSTDAGGNLTNPDESIAEHRIEVYSPPYIGAANRPSIEETPPSIAYSHAFTVRMSNSNAIHRVAITRCGSFTHAFDGDQRYLSLKFTKSGDTLTVTAPSSPALAPPGHYMLWVLRDENTPCQLAHFIRVCEQGCEIILDRSTFSVLEVEAALLEPNTEGLAEFQEAFYVYFDGFLPHELGLPTGKPDIDLAVSSPGGAVPEGISVRLHETGFDSQPPHPDIGQRFTFTYDIRFASTDVFDFPSTDLLINVRASLAGYTCDRKIRLIKTPNPYMKDGDPPWLSRDLRVFQIRPGGAVGATTFADSDTPHTFIQRLIQDFDAQADSDMHPFENLATGQEESTLELATTVDGEPVYNFAVAKVRYRAIAQPAPGVRVLFRLFNTVGTALEWTYSTSYRREIKGAAGQDTVALLGVTGFPFGDIISIPFFAEPRVTPLQSMKDQPDGPNKRDIPGAGAAESARYFGCWLDFNQGLSDHHFPWKPSNDGPYSEDPYEGGPLSPIIDLVRNAHQCMVAEVYFEDDPLNFGDTPDASDNLSQRNIVWEMSSNPGVAATRRVQTTMLVRPTKVPPALVGSPTAGQGLASNLALLRRDPVDHLVIFWKNLPAGTTIDVYIPQIKADDVLRLVAYRQGSGGLEKVDAHTLRATSGNMTYVPLPAKLDRLVPALFSVQLPQGVTAGQRYRCVVQQYSGRTKQVLGAVDIAIPVEHAPQIVPREIRKYTVLKYIKSRIPAGDIWKPVFDRYVGEIEDRLRGFGEDPDKIQGSNHVGERKPKPPGEEGVEDVTGRVSDILYDCAGVFVGFVIDDCGSRRRFTACEPGLERVIREACESRSRMTVWTREGENRPVRILRHCC